MPTDERFDLPLYSVTEAARYLDVPVSTFRTWVHGYERRPDGKRPVIGRPIVTTLPHDAGVSVPFVGLAEAHALAAIRGAGVPLQRVRPALDLLQQELGIEHVLASRSLYTGGAELLYDFAEREGDTPEARSARELVVVRNGQRVFNDIVDSYLRRVEFCRRWLGRAYPSQEVRQGRHCCRPTTLLRDPYLRPWRRSPGDRDLSVQGRHRYRRSDSRVRSSP